MAPRVKVRLFHELRTNVGQSELELEANTLNELIQTLIQRYSTLMSYYSILKANSAGTCSFTSTTRFKTRHLSRGN